MPQFNKISPCLWFNDQGEQAAEFYTQIFPDSAIGSISHYPEDAEVELHGNTPGRVMTVEFTLAGQRFMALNGGPHFQFTPAISLVVRCEDQQEIDEYWEKLGAGGDPAAQQCGWLADRFGLSWQIVPRQLEQWFQEADAAASARLMKAILAMKKIDIAALEAATRG